MPLSTRESNSLWPAQFNRQSTHMCALVLYYCVGLRVCVCVQLGRRACVGVYVCVIVWSRDRVCVSVCVCLCVCVSLCVWGGVLCVFVLVCLCLCLCVWLCQCLCMCMCVCVCVFVGVFVCVCVPCHVCVRDVSASVCIRNKCLRVCQLRAPRAFNRQIDNKHFAIWRPHPTVSFHTHG